MGDAMTGLGVRPRGARQVPPVITDARIATSAEMAGRVRRYALTMAFRTACFLAMIFVPGVFRWILFGCAVFLPYLAVIFANQAHTRSRTGAVTTAPPADAPQLTTGPPPGEVIAGDVLADDERHRDRVA